jgi:plasmid stability protein
MGEVRVRKLQDWVVGWFRSQAKQHGHSLERELRETLTEAVVRRKQEIAQGLRDDLERFRDQYGTFSDSARLIREDRDERG